ncbi:hypothetical protein AARAC_011669, partial [Aspergillus arachidicola]
MKAGGAFVLLDPAHPVARRREICRAVSAELIVASVAEAATAGELAPQVVAVGEASMSSWADPGPRWDGSSVTPDNALYVVFTSGSTGTPKGVVIPHGPFATSASAQGRGYPSPLIPVFFIFGGCLCIPSDDDRRNNLSTAAAKLGITFALLTPSAARLLQPASLTDLNTLVFVGEVVTSHDILQWSERVPITNAYGPAECSAAASFYPTMRTAHDISNIGWGAGCVCWVVDRADHERLVPIGAVGELVIEGPIVGRGYLNDPAKTAAAFINPPAWLRQFRMIYPGNPGDLVQYAVDGSLQFIGRKDTQVKLRGQRIELGEVEHHTRICFPGARDVVAEIVTPEEAGRPPVLIAFVRVGQTGPVEQEEDRPAARILDGEDILAAPTEAFRAAIATAEAALHDTVPAYMVPAAFLPLVGVPLMATGKTDRRRLRERAAVFSRSELALYHGTTTAKRAPTTPAERTLQQLWARS